MIKIPGTRSSKKNQGLTRRAPGLMALEPRYMFDGAAVSDAVDMVVDTTIAQALDLRIHSPVALDGSAALARAEAGKLVADFLARSDVREQLFAMFGGANPQTEPSAAWMAAVDQLLHRAAQGELGVQLELRSHAELHGAKGAFSAQGTAGEPVIYLNADWLATADSSSVTKVLVEELGHYLDHAINGDDDTPGDEGEMFAHVVVDAASPLSVAFLRTEDDRATLTIDGQHVLAELASFSFVNAYEMVYDLNNSTNTLGVVNAAIDTTERWADKEQNLHYFNATNALGAVRISDGSNNQNFSGNDVSAISVAVGGTTYYGWISRPIKSNGVVRGFYFWTDTRFTSLAAAQADGNQDGDRTVLNNRGFLFVVDQAWFTTEISSGTARTLNNAKDGNLGTVTVASVGSSSDRVDSALNSLITPNTVLASADSLTVLEDSGTTSGNLFANDADPNGDNFVVSSFSVGGVTYVPGSTANLTGIGTITIDASGGFSFTPAANYSGPVPVIGYTITDDFGATATSTLSIAVTQRNDAPAGTDKTISTFENRAYVLRAEDFGFTDPNDTPAHAFLSVIITSLPTAGTLTLNGVAVTAGQEILVSALGGLVFTPALNANGSSYASLTFQVRDTGGTANGGVNLDVTPNTMTFNVQAVNTAPAAVADEATVGEAGGVNNDSNPTPTVSGNVLDNDTDPDTGDTKTVTAVSGLNTGTVGASVAGRYGSLVLNANGSYTYTTDNNNAAVQALRLTTDRLTDTFSYTVTDAAGLSSTTTLTITITGANDHPVAVNDYNSVKELGSATVVDGVDTYGSASGNVLTNDSDVDGSTLVIESARLLSADSDVLTVTSPISSATYTVVSVAGNWNANNGIDDDASQAQSVLIGTTVVLRQDNGQPLTVYRIGTGANARLIFNHPATLYAYSRDTIFGASDSTSTYKISNITAVVDSSTQLEVTGGNLADIAVGDVVTGSGMPSGVTVTAINAGTKTITLSQAVQVTSRDLTFSASGGGTSSASITAGSPATLTGTYGTLSLSSNGAYTYWLTSTALNDGEVKTETFSYTVNDSAGGSSTANLYIRIDGYSVEIVAAANDIHEISEDGTLDVSVADGVLANDTPSSTVSGFTWGNLTGTVGTALTYDGVGTLTLRENGSFIFVPAADFHGTVPSVLYTISNGAGRASAYLNITVAAVNDAPTAQADAATAREAGGYGNDLPGHNPSGNVLLNDADKDGNTLTVSAVSVTGGGAGTVNQALAGIYGTLLLSSTGAYTYTLDNDNATVQALARGATLTESFTYTAYDGTLGNTSTLVITIHGANDAPVNTVPGSALEATEGVSTLINGLSVADADDNNLTVRLSVSAGTLLLGTTTGLTITNGTNGQAAFTVSGTKAHINAALATLTYTSGASFTSNDTLTLQTTDGDGLNAVDSLRITITDNRPLTVSGTTVNEASPYVMFQVTGAAGQKLTLALGNTAATTDADAESGKDFLPNLQYFDGTQWLNYTGQAVAIPLGGTTLLVRTPVLQDTADEGAETLTLTATNRAGTSSTPGISTIRDDGTGDIFLGNNNSLTPNAAGDTDPNGPDFPVFLDDDRPVTVNNIVVNEASPYAVFVVNGQAGQTLQLALSSGTALLGTDTSNAERFEVFNGSGWVTYTAGTNIVLAGNRLSVRLPLTQDNTYEGVETFFLGVKQMGSGATVYGTALILDDGNGTKFVFDNDNNPANDPETPTLSTGPGNGFDDDRRLSVRGGSFNESSPRAIFTVDATEGFELTLDVQDAAQAGKAPTGDNEGKPDDSLNSAPIWYSIDGGGTWALYTGPITAGPVPVLVAVDITNERDDVFEGEEQFKLVVTTDGLSAFAYSSIFDNGTGTVAREITPQTTNDTGADIPGAARDDDRPKPAPPIPAASPVAAPAAARAEVPPAPVALPPQAFASTLQPLAPRPVTAETPPPLGDVVTSGAGYQIPVSDSAPRGLTINRGVTDQFVQSTENSTKISLPFDAFIHSDKDAVIALEAKLADDAALPNWVQFDPATGVFEVTPPKGFKGKLDVKVIARDDDGREATVLFQMFIGEQSQDRAQSRESLTAKLRMAAKRPIAPVRESVPMRARAG